MPVSSLRKAPTRVSDRTPVSASTQGDSLRDVLRHSFARHGNRVAVVADEHRLTYEALWNKAGRVARHLYGRGLRPLDRVVLHLPNIPEFIILYLALQRVGAVPLVALPQHRGPEIYHYVEIEKPVGYAIPRAMNDLDSLEYTRKTRGSADTLEWVLVASDGTVQGDGFISLGWLLENEPDVPARVLDELGIDPTEPCLLQLASDTIGRPRMTARSHDEYIDSTRTIARVNGIHRDDTLLVVTPFSDSFPLTCPGIVGFFLAGARVVIGSSSETEHVLPLIEKESVTHTAVPGHLSLV